MEAIKELVNDRKKLLADKRSLMLEVKQLKERLSTPASPPVEDESTSPSSPSSPRDGLDAPSPEPTKKPLRERNGSAMGPPGLEPGTNGL